MSRALLLSIKPRFVAKILNGEKTIEIRKTMPKCDLPIDVYIYCTKEETYWKYPYLNEKNARNKYGICDWWCEYNEDTILINEGMPEEYKTYKCRGKVVAKFTLNKVEEIRFDDKEVQRNACLTKDELFDYLFVNEPYHEDMKKGYAWHISNLTIFDKPKELWEFKHWVFYKKCEKCPYGKCDYDYSLCSQCCEIKPLTKAPQSFCYIEVEENK